MIMINDKLSDGHVFEMDTQLNGMVTGDASVGPGVKLEVNGMIAGDLTVRPDAKVLIGGTVTGNLINDNGHVAVSGVVGGTVTDRGERKTVLNSGSIVNGNRV